MTEDEVRREVDRLRRQVEYVDTHGTRGVAVIQSQLNDLIKDVTKLEGRMEAHEKMHVSEANEHERRRAAAWRWAVGTALAFLVLLVSILALVLDKPVR